MRYDKFTTTQQALPMPTRGGQRPVIIEPQHPAAGALNQTTAALHRSCSVWREWRCVARRRSSCSDRLPKVQGHGGVVSVVA